MTDPYRHRPPDLSGRSPATRGVQEQHGSGRDLTHPPGPNPRFVVTGIAHVGCLGLSILSTWRSSPDIDRIDNQLRFRTGARTSRPSVPLQTIPRSAHEGSQRMRRPFMWKNPSSTPIAPDYASTNSPDRRPAIFHCAIRSPWSGQSGVPMPAAWTPVRSALKTRSMRTG